jgi:putative ABC transport system substrate-binding protein
MKRREIAVLAGATVMALPIRLAAQRTRTARLGILHDGPRDAVIDAMIKKLGQLGWVEGRNLVIEFRTLDYELKQSAAMVKELVQLKCDVIQTYGTPAALAVKSNAPATPMLFVIGGDPVGLGLVSSLSRPGGNATGYMLLSQQIILKQFSLLRDLTPTAKRIAVTFEAGNPSMMQGVQTLQTAASAVGIAIEPIGLRDYKDVDAAYLKLKDGPVDGLLVMSDRITGAYDYAIANLAQRLRLPGVYGSRSFIDYGGVVSYGIDWPALVVLSADYVARMLGGAKPADLPVQQVTQFELIVNLSAARSQGLSVPQSVLLQATEVIR